MTFSASSASSAVNSYKKRDYKLIRRNLPAVFKEQDFCWRFKRGGMRQKDMQALRAVFGGAVFKQGRF